ncbi:hypothetical protein GDO81_002977 [Engystomops pustulosus]|uniref:Uncharacterized protein n=1 Tax=Engystomops pustulosus TaxID=76066 RepID=A0AAV7DRP1_ENGPU|nr:hypothetical protein GDO81_002977 [Engystomops pustulosus]
MALCVLREGTDIRDFYWEPTLDPCPGLHPTHPGPDTSFPNIQYNVTSYYRDYQEFSFNDIYRYKKCELLSICEPERRRYPYSLRIHL